MSDLPAPPDTALWQAFRVDAQRARLEADGVTYRRFFSGRAVTAGLWVPEPGGEAAPFVELDNITYYVASGAGDVLVGADTVPVRQGDALFVRGREERAVLGTEDDLVLVSLSAVGRPGLDDPSWVRFGPDDISPRLPGDRNYRNSLLDAGTLEFGVYLVSREVGSDLLVRHSVDEVKYVARGGGTIEIEDDVYGIEAGSVVFVDGAARHRFTKIWRDLRVLFVLAR